MTVSIATVPSHAAGDQFTQPMWQTLEDNINQGIVEQVGCMVKRTTNQNVATATTVTLSLDTDVQDVYGMWSAGSPTIITAPVKGWYRCSAFVQWAAQATSQASEIRFVVNGSTQVTCGLDMNSDNTHPTYHTCSTELYLQAGDQVTVTVVQRSGGTVAVTNATIVVVRV